MLVRRYLRPPGQVSVIFMTVALLSTGTLAALSWQLLELDRKLEAQGRRGLLEGAADTTLANVATALAQLDLILDRPDAENLDGVSIISIGPAGTVVRPGASLLFVPTRAPLPEADAELFADASSVEFQPGGLPRARALYDALVTHTSRPVRATALNRLARVQLNLGDLSSSLRSYEMLAKMDDVAVGGLPGGLVASVGRASALASRGMSMLLDDAALTLAADLADARWPLFQSEYDFYAAQVATWRGSPIVVTKEDLARSDAAAWLWTQRTSLPPDGRRLLAQPRGSAVMVWRASGTSLKAAIGGPAFLETLVKNSVPGGFTAVLRDEKDAIAVGTAAPGQEWASRVVSTTVPWSLQVADASSLELPANSPRRGLLLLVISVTALVLGAGWYFIARALGRERRAARLQNDFVAAVSHEFRSPLTSLAHLSELLAHDRLSTDAQRRHAYAVMVGDTARLRDMVEHLLDFGRFDTGGAALRLEDVDIDATVREIVDDARRRVSALGFTIELAGLENPAIARVDKDALGRAIWNLIDNAVKYSPECRTVWVATAREGDRISISVRDQGLGIPLSEQTDIFLRFVRGEESKSRRIKGTGIGLALVRQIVDAHGGEIELISAPGQGSQFVVRLRAAGGAV